MVRVTLDGALRASVIFLALSLSLAALAHAWGATTRTTVATTGAWPGVIRENLLTGEVRFCTPQAAAGMVCLSSDKRPALTGGKRVDPTG